MMCSLTERWKRILLNNPNLRELKIFSDICQEIWTNYLREDFRRTNCSILCSRHFFLSIQNNFCWLLKFVERELFDHSSYSFKDMRKSNKMNIRFLFFLEWKMDFSGEFSLSFENIFLSFDRNSISKYFHSWKSLDIFRRTWLQIKKTENVEGKSILFHLLLESWKRSHFFSFSNLNIEWWEKEDDALRKFSIYLFEQFWSTVFDMILFLKQLINVLPPQARRWGPFSDRNHLYGGTGGYFLCSKNVYFPVVGPVLPFLFSWQLNITLLVVKDHKNQD